MNVLVAGGGGSATPVASRARQEFKTRARRRLLLLDWADTVGRVCAAVIILAILGLAFVDRASPVLRLLRS